MGFTFLEAPHYGEVDNNNNSNTTTLAASPGLLGKHIAMETDRKSFKSQYIGRQVNRKHRRHKANEVARSSPSHPARFLGTGQQCSIFASIGDGVLYVSSSADSKLDAPESALRPVAEPRASAPSA
ncbi:hypothetical protein E4U59_004777 [Claviceps monticola]|nr:hypothetical protein E4U59_004777 [Claviceps monticola]